MAKTTNVLQRIAWWRTATTHKPVPFDRVEFFPCEVEELNQLEAEHIWRCQPKFNVEGRQKSYRPVDRSYLKGVSVWPKVAKTVVPEAAT